MADLTNMAWWQWALVVVMPLTVAIHIAAMATAQNPEQQKIRYYSINFGLCCTALAVIAFGFSHELPVMLGSITALALYGGARPAARSAHIASRRTR